VETQPVNGSKNEGQKQLANIWVEPDYLVPPREAERRNLREVVNTVSIQGDQGGATDERPLLGEVLERRLETLVPSVARSRLHGNSILKGSRGKYKNERAKGWNELQQCDDIRREAISREGHDRGCISFQRGYEAATGSRCPFISGSFV
jgi:hypothetical protein